MTNYGLVIDQERCIGCHACAVSCKQENNVPMGQFWNRVLTEGGEKMDTPSGGYPEDGGSGSLDMQYQPTACQHCENAPCVKVCPVNATYTRDDGIVEIDYDTKEVVWEYSWHDAYPNHHEVHDADRLPNGNTLITDTHSNRIIEVNRSGDVVWEVSYPRAYEAERLGTGDESAGGQSAQALGLTNVTTGGGAAAVSGGGGGGLKGAVESIVPAKVRHGVLWVVPPWATFFDVFLLAVFAFTLLVWAGAELYWTDRVRFRSPVVLDR